MDTPGLAAHAITSSLQVTTSYKGHRKKRRNIHSIMKTARNGSPGLPDYSCPVRQTIKFASRKAQATAVLSLQPPPPLLLLVDHLKTIANSPVLCHYIICKPITTGTGKLISWQISYSRLSSCGLLLRDIVQAINPGQVKSVASVIPLANAGASSSNGWGRGEKSAWPRGSIRRNKYSQPPYRRGKKGIKVHLTPSEQCRAENHIKTQRGKWKR
ncbi:hypothetical protein F4775DRAFT_462241 [Biscogniauxia sp. FL1348]|nr:hypothetical protein F4775DRAFT_462241 [Biscogniauxia sp. FL1348]